MDAFKDIKQIYLLGIGGIGMSALAFWFQRIGKKVAGYDSCPSEITDLMQKDHIEIHFEDSVDNIPYRYRSNNDYTLIVYTPAVKDTNKELEFFRNHSYKILKRAEAIGLIAKSFDKVIAVAGTHGKTTTVSIIAHLLNVAQKNFTAFIGGIANNFESNLVINDNHSDSESILLIEADEYDKSFLQLYPHISIITSIDPDHMDIYHDMHTLQKTFYDFISQVSINGYVIVHSSVANQFLDIKGPKIISYDAFNKGSRL